MKDEAGAIRRSWGSAVRKERERRGITQVELARAAGSSQAALSRLERGEQEPSLALALAVAAALDMTYAALFRLPTEVPAP
jgi:transcriptional regulator with XRE-family HTH domain